MHYLGEELPSVGDGFALEIVAERPVAKHLEHGVVVGVVAHLFEVVVFAADAKALLGVAHAGIGSLGIAKKDVFKLIHARIGKHQRGVVFHHHGCTGNNVVILALEKFKEFAAYFVVGHIGE